ncbi:hypothetical protein [Arthrobacter sp. JSM 101049]
MRPRRGELCRRVECDPAHAAPAPIEAGVTRLVTTSSRSIVATKPKDLE